MGSLGNRRYDPDFKREAVRLVLVVLEGMGVREVERNLDITFGVVKGWVQKQRVYELREDGIRTGKNRVWRLMQQHDLWGKTSKTLQGYNEFRAYSQSNIK